MTEIGKTVVGTEKIVQMKQVEQSTPTASTMGKTKFGSVTKDVAIPTTIGKTVLGTEKVVQMKQVEQSVGGTTAKTTVTKSAPNPSPKN